MSPKRQSGRIPRLRRHQTGQGTVRLAGIDYYLGVWPKDEAEPPEKVRQAYDRKIQEWLAADRGGPTPAHRLTVNQLAARYLRHLLLSFSELPSQSRRHRRSPWRYALSILGETMLTRPQAAKMAGVSVDTLASWMGKGRQGVRLEGYFDGCRWRTSAEALDRFLRRLTPGGQKRMSTVREDGRAERQAVDFLRERGIVT